MDFTSPIAPPPLPSAPPICLPSVVDTTSRSIDSVSASITESEPYRYFIYGPTWSYCSDCPPTNSLPPLSVGVEVDEDANLTRALSESAPSAAMDTLCSTPSRETM